MWDTAPRPLRGQLPANARALREAVDDGRVFFGTKALPSVAAPRAAGGGRRRRRRLGGRARRRGGRDRRQRPRRPRQQQGHGFPPKGRVDRSAGRPRHVGRGARRRRRSRARPGSGHTGSRRRHARGDPDGPPRVEVRPPARPGPRGGRRRARPRPRRARRPRARRIAARGLRRPGGDDRAPAAFVAGCRDELGWTAQVDLGGGFGIRFTIPRISPDAAELAQARRPQHVSPSSKRACRSPRSGSSRAGAWSAGRA